ncbi:MAG TPA: hypothetical protein VES02_15175, partial [Dermatophilaceae bacterium]|nr:hypothetical protein [Dermatophilaceae bacterium]
TADHDRSDKERPTLHLVSSAQGNDSNPVGESPDRRDPDSQTSATAAPSSPVEEARAILAAEDPATYHKNLSSLARQGHHSVLQPLPYTPSLEFHDPTCVVVEPKPGGVDTIELYANAAYPAYDEVLLSVFRSPVVAEQLNALYQMVFSEGSNVAIVTNHGQIIDIALVMGAMIHAMCEPGRKFGVLDDEIEVEDLAVRLNVLVSRMVTTRQAFNVPAMQVLQCGGRTFLSVPQTHSRRRAKLDPSVVRANNLVMRHELDLRMSEGGQILAMAASGSQDLSLAAGLVQKVRAQWRQRRGTDPGDTDTVHLQPLYDGTMQLMLNCKYVMPIAIALDPAAPALVVGSMTRVRQKDDCHRIMEWIADAQQTATGIPTIYHRQEDDLLTQVRALVKL